MQKNILKKQTIAFLMACLMICSNITPVMATSEIIEESEPLSSVSEVVDNGTIALSVTDNKGNALGEFEFSIKDSNGNLIQFVTNNGNYEATSNGYYKTVKTNSNGKINITGLASGTYTVAYADSNTDYIATSDARVTVANDTVNTSIQLKENVGTLILTLSSEDDTAISGAKFVIKDSNGQNLSFSVSGGVYTYTSNGTEALESNTAGKITVEKLPVGNYSLIQTESPVEYNGALISQNFTITLSNETRISAISTKEYGDVNIHVVDANSSNAINGSEFNILDANGNKLFFNNIDNKYQFSRTDGTNVIKVVDGAVLVQGLPVGNYTLTETSAPKNYNKTENMGFSISKNNQTTLTVKNTKAVGVLDINVIDSTTNEGVKDYTFKITDSNKKEIKFTKNSDGKYTFNKEGEETNIISNGDGKIVLSDLPVGTYIITQVKATKGYIIDTAEIQQTITSQNTTSYKVEVSKSNTSLTVVNKNNEPVPNIDIEILNKDKEIVFEGKTNENGKLLIIGVTAGEYSYKTKNIPSPYVNKEYSQNFKINEKGEVSDLESCVLEYSKITIDTKVKEKGAIFKLIDTKDEEKVLTAETNKDGIAIFEKIEDGEYELTQVEAAKGYVVSENKETIIINRDTKENKSFEFKNVSIKEKDSESEESSKTTETDEKDKKTSGTWLIVVFIILIILAAAIYGVIKTKKEENEENNNENDNSTEDIPENTTLQFVDDTNKEKEEETQDIILNAEDRKPDIEEFKEDPYEQEALDEANKTLEETVSAIMEDEAKEKELTDKNNLDETNNDSQEEKGDKEKTLEENSKKDEDEKPDTGNEISASITPAKGIDKEKTSTETKKE